jgi:hypothetical protein
MQVYIGYDRREPAAYNVAAHTLRLTSGLEPIGLDVRRLRRSGLYNRTAYVHPDGARYDAISEAPMSTEFAISRFLVPIIHQTGYALFTDCDVVFLRDVKELFYEADPSYAVSVVKHDYVPKTTTKMDGQRQVPYTRKNWSSVMIFNLEHAGNRRLTLHDVNTRSGLDLHSFYWLNDSEIGELPPEWNWLVGEQPKPANPGIAHYTLGGAWLPNWTGAEHDEIWLEANKLVSLDKKSILFPGPTC